MRDLDDRPGAASKKVYRRMSPTLSVLPVLYEALGLTDDQSDYVYLSDGGHFENLALYEMVLRRCHLYCRERWRTADAKYEYFFNDLGNAIRKIRIDLGIPDRVPRCADLPRAGASGERKAKVDAIGRLAGSAIRAIDYLSNGHRANDGIVIYIKPAVYEDEPREDVVHYKTHSSYPSRIETTSGPVLRRTAV